MFWRFVGIDKAQHWTKLSVRKWLHLSRKKNSSLILTKYLHEIIQHKKGMKNKRYKHFILIYTHSVRQLVKRLYWADGFDDNEEWGCDWYNGGKERRKWRCRFACHMVSIWGNGLIRSFSGWIWKWYCCSGGMNLFGTLRTTECLFVIGCAQAPYSIVCRVKCRKIHFQFGIDPLSLLWHLSWH